MPDRVRNLGVALTVPPDRAAGERLTLDRLERDGVVLDRARVQLVRRVGDRLQQRRDGVLEVVDDDPGVHRGRPLVGEGLLRVLDLTRRVVRDRDLAEPGLEAFQLAVLERALVRGHDDQVDDRQHAGHDDEQPEREPPADATQRAHCSAGLTGRGSGSRRLAR